MLPICKVCLQNGCNIIVRAATQHALAKEARIGVEAAKEAGRQEHDIVTTAAIVPSIAAPTPVATSVVTPVATSAAATAPRPNSRKRTSTRCMLISTLASPSFLVNDLAYL